MRTKTTQRHITNSFKKCDFEQLLERRRESALLVDDECPKYPSFDRATSLIYDYPNWKRVGLDDYGKMLQVNREAKIWGQFQPFWPKIVALWCSAFIHGSFQSSYNDLNVALIEVVGLTDQRDSLNGPKQLWTFVGLNALSYLSASLCGRWISEQLQWRYCGRHRANFALAFVCYASLFRASFATNLKQLMVNRTLFSCILGVESSTRRIFYDEASPSHPRGTLALNWQVWDAFGTFLGFALGMVSSSAGLQSWRLQTASAYFPMAALMVFAWTVPKSLVGFSRRHNVATYLSLCVLNGTAGYRQPPSSSTRVNKCRSRSSFHPRIHVQRDSKLEKEVIYQE